jgi:predicted acyltransferase
MPQSMTGESTDVMVREGRVLSVDLYRGVVMFLLIGTATGFYDLLAAPALDGTILHALGLQFQHHPWHGLRLFDLGQPFFIFISGVAMVFSYEKRWARGESWRATLGQALRRSLLLLALGWALYLVGSEPGGFKGAFLFDILPQLAFASLVAFLLIRRPARTQAGVALGLVVLTELLYRLWPVIGFNQPFTAGHNFGSWVDTALFGAASEENLVTFNIVPAAAFAILGVLAAEMLKGGRTQKRKLVSLVGAGVAGVALGLALDPLTPIIRRLCTSSFVVLSGGLAFLSLALGYWLIDVMKFRKRSVFFVIVGMNPVFIYLFALSGGADWLTRIVAPFTMAFSGWMGEGPAQILTSLAVWGLLWALCYWLYRRKIFIRI